MTENETPTEAQAIEAVRAYFDGRRDYLGMENIKGLLAAYERLVKTPPTNG